jgi:hypothetical protein
MVNENLHAPGGRSRSNSNVHSLPLSHHNLVALKHFDRKCIGRTDDVYAFFPPSGCAARRAVHSSTHGRCQQVVPFSDDEGTQVREWAGASGHHWHGGHAHDRAAEGQRAGRAEEGHAAEGEGIPAASGVDDRTHVGYRTAVESLGLCRQRSTDPTELRLVKQKTALPDRQRRAIRPGAGQIRSMMVPVAKAPPPHMVTSARLPPVRSSSWRAVVMRRAPVEPTG